MTSAIRLTGIEKSFGAVRANRGADLDVDHGVLAAHDVEPGTADMLRNEDITFTARVEKGHADALRLELYGKRGSRLRYDLKQDRNDPAVFRFVVDGSSLGKGYEDGFRYRVYGGRTWSKQQAITLGNDGVDGLMVVEEALPRGLRDGIGQRGVAVPAVEGVVAVPERLPLREIVRLYGTDQQIGGCGHVA